MLLNDLGELACHFRFYVNIRITCIKFIGNPEELLHFGNFDSINNILHMFT